MAPRSRSFSTLKGESQKGFQESKQIAENHILSQVRARVLSLSHTRTHTPVRQISTCSSRLSSYVTTFLQPLPSNTHSPCFQKHFAQGT